MRSWVWGGSLAAVTAGGVYFVLAGSGGHGHCGGCLACTAPTAAPAPVLTDEPVAPSVVQVVDVHAVLSQPAEPRPRPFVSFDEPPLAKRPAAVAPDVIPISFSEPTDMEIAPPPRRVPANRPPLATADDPF